MVIHDFFSWTLWKTSIEEEIDGLGGWVRIISWNPNGDEIAVGLGGFNLTDKRGAVLVYDSKGDMLWSYKTSSPIVNLEWVSNGKNLFAATKTGEVYLFNPVKGKIIWNTNLHAYIFDASWNPSKKAIAVATGIPASGVYLFDINGSLRWSKPSSMEAYDVEWSSNGELLAVCYTMNIPTTSGKLVIYQFNGKQVYSYNTSSEFWKSSFSPSMNYLVIVYGFPYHSVVTYKFNGSLVKPASKAYLGGSVWSIFWRASKLMLAVGFPGNRFVITSPTDLKNGITLGVLKGDLTASAPNPEGNIVAISTEWFEHYTKSHGSLYVYDSNGQLLWSTNRLNGGGYALDWSPNGKELIVGTKLGTLYLLDTNHFRYGAYLDGLSLLVGILLFMVIVILVNIHFPRLLKFF